jgi:uncharacterized protein
MDRPAVPLDQYVLKVHSRCDLACDHCYVYESADQSWRTRPTALPDDVISRTAQRIAEHAEAHRLRTVYVVLHGGEPLLAGAPRLRQIINQLHSALRGICHLDLRIHTNGVQLNEQFCDLFAQYDVKVGISIDGDQAANDRHRRYANGRSSYDKVTSAIGLLRTARYRHLYAGLLCTIDVANDPLTVYDSLMDLRPPRIDFLLPHATWDAPPVRTPGADTEYADWLIPIFDRWLADGRPTGIRTFESVLSTLTGGASFTEALGLAPSSLVVIETDGTYEQADSLKTAFDGAPATGLNVFSHAVDVAGQHPGILARQRGLAALSQTCKECPVVTSCGGGLYAHRYRPATGFDNPSVYCADLLKLITHIEGRLPSAITESRHMPNQVISDDDFHQLAAGYGSAAAVTKLAETQQTLGRALLTAVYQESNAAAVVPDADRLALRSAWSVLALADQERPETLASVLGHPYVRVWAARCLEKLKLASAARNDPSSAPDVPGLRCDLGHLGAIAAVVAIRAGDKADLRVPVIDNAIHLPTLGRLALSTTSAGQPPEVALAYDGRAVHIQTGDDRWEITGAALLSGEPCIAASFGSSASAEWQPVRMLNAPGGIRVALEDTDPYRDCHQWPAASRLTDADVAQWQRLFRDAWLEIERDYAAYVPAIAAGLTVLMPLSPAPAGHDVSATARHAFGAVGAALPADATTLALLIMHEFQHVKLGALLDLYQLFDMADDRLYYAPWREDMRPLEGLLQGTYAHLAVSEYWRTRQKVASGSACQVASERFTFWHTHTRDAIETLAESGSMTPLGMRFVEQMRHSIN